jgi:hypothetical protein
MINVIVAKRNLRGMKARGIEPSSNRIRTHLCTFLFNFHLRFYTHMLPLFSAIVGAFLCATVEITPCLC